ncbi:hypothetical protein CDD82_5541 [Ophiocordyceps australis]|uniref:ferric-chelate reductase (NADPH) n=1 Tax=Ophiocordyceps australis TaxID=1399860 RepID=A0A2C5Z2A1_9HYPO|nr:hypothetical protein CDD82_5541 [Ophiocordyceps australis]
MRLQVSALAKLVIDALYEADYAYALPTTYFLLLVIIVFTLIRFSADLTPKSLSSRSWWRRGVSAARFVSYKTWRVYRWNSPPLGTLIIASGGLVFFAALTLGPKPYYWPTDALYGNSPPLATRSGWIALGCLPFVLVFGAKANLVSALIGTPPEKLNVWHNYLSWALFTLALMHTFPFIVYHGSRGDTVDEFHKNGVWLTGIIALVAQAWLTVMSIPWIRNRWYEFFKASHYFFAIVFLVFLFLHCDFRLTSWDYIIAAIVLYSASLLFVMTKTFFKHGISHTARLHAEPSGSLRIAIQTKFNWGPGQHVYLRFLTCGIHALTSHPFTVSSLPNPKVTSQGGELVFLVQSRKGITQRLVNKAKKQPDVSVRVLIEGPYGGLPPRWYQGFDRTLLIAGGAGCCFTLPLIQDWLRGYDVSTARELHVFISTRDSDMRLPYLQELHQIAARHCQVGFAHIPGLFISFFESQASGIARQLSPISQNSTVFGEDKPQFPARHDVSTVFSLVNASFAKGRPDCGSIIKDLALREPQGSVGIAVCGPSGMVQDVASTAAEHQLSILRGQSSVTEVWLHKEIFSC